MNTATRKPPKTEEALRLHREAVDKVKLQYTDDSDDRAWVVAYSGGKDSSLLAHVVFEALSEIRPSRRKRRVYVVCSDTPPESTNMTTKKKPKKALTSSSQTTPDLRGRERDAFFAAGGTAKQWGLLARVVEGRRLRTPWYRSIPARTREADRASSVRWDERTVDEPETRRWPSRPPLN